MEPPDGLVASVDDLTQRVAMFRDQYVVHRSRLNPRAMRGLAIDRDKRVSLSVGWIYPQGNEPTDVIESSDPLGLHSALLDYVADVLDFIESSGGRR